MPLYTISTMDYIAIVRRVLHTDSKSVRRTGGPGVARASSTIIHWPQLARADRLRAKFAEVWLDRLLACIWTRAATGR